MTPWETIIVLFSGTAVTILVNILWLPYKLGAMREKLDTISEQVDTLQSEVYRLGKRVSAATGKSNGE